MAFISAKIKRTINSLKYITFRRCLNLAGLGLSYLFSLFTKQRLVHLSPFFISIEVTDYCNLHCPECPVGKSNSTKKKQTNFDFNAYKKLIDELKPTLQHVILYFQGEPMLNKQLTEFIQYAHHAKIYTSTSTNGQFLNKKSAKKIVESGLDKLIVSVDGCTQEVYEQYRVGGSLQKAIDGISELVYWKSELKSATPLIEMQCVVFKTNEHQLDDMKQLAKKLKVDRVKFKTAQLYNFENGNKLLTSIEKYARYQKISDGKYRIKSKLPNHCSRLWGGSVIDAQGEVLPCCFDKNSEFSFGNITKNSFSTNWHSKKASDFRGFILQNRKQVEICRNCLSR